MYISLEVAFSLGLIFALIGALGCRIFGLSAGSKPFTRCLVLVCRFLYRLSLLWLLLPCWAFGLFFPFLVFVFRTFRIHFSGGAFFFPPLFGAAWCRHDSDIGSAAIAETVRAGMHPLIGVQSEAALPLVFFSRVQSLRFDSDSSGNPSNIPPMTNSLVAANKDCSLAVAHWLS